MIYLFTGDDAKNKILNYEKFIKSVPPSTEILFINRNNFDRMQIESLSSGAGLFFAKSVVVFTGVFEREDTGDFILEKLPLMQTSLNAFVFIESKLDKITLDKFKKNEADIKVFELPKEKKEKFNNFLLANAFGMKDKLNLWIYFRQAVDLGVGLDELSGVLFWKVKDMILKMDFSKFKEEKLQDVISKLALLLPEARTTGVDVELAFEKFLLEVF
jgi:hypothetical protein